MRITLVALLCLVLSTPAYAQKSEARQNKEKLATLVFWSGISVAAAGASTMAASKSVGTMFLLPGAGLVAWGVVLNNQAKNMPSTTFGITPTKKGVAFSVNRSW